MKTQTKILIVEHDQYDIEMIESELKNGKINFLTQVVQTGEDYERAINSFQPDIILADYTLPSFSGLEAFKIREAMVPDTPFIFVSGTIGEDNSIELIKNGATDFALKENLYTLPAKVKRALMDAKGKRTKATKDVALAESEKRLAKAQQVAHIGSWELNFATGIATWSEECCKIYGLDPKENQQTFDSWASFIHPEDKEFVMNVASTSQRSLSPTSMDHRIIKKDGTVRHIHSESRFEIGRDGKPKGLYGIAHDITDAWVTGEELRKSEANLSALFRTTDVGFLFADLDYKIIALNECIRDWSKTFSAATLQKGMNLKESLDFPERLADFEKMMDLAERGQQFIIETCRITPDGNINWFNVKGKPVIGDNNKVAGLCLAINNITAKKLAEEKLLASEIRYRRLFEAAKDGVLLLNAETGDIEDVNPFLTELLGYSYQEFMGKQLWEIGLFKDIEANQDYFLRLQKEGMLSNTNLALKTKGGHAIWVEFVSNAYEAGGIQVIQCNVRDITERHDSEETIKNSESRLKEAQQIAKLGNWELDLANGFLTLSEEASRIFGLEEGQNQLSQEAWNALVHPDDLGPVLSLIKESQKSLSDTSYHLRIVLEDGTVKHILSLSRFKPDEAGKPISIYGIAQDVTERKVTEEKIAESEKQLTFDKSNLSALINNTNDLMWSVDIDFKLITYNQPLNDIVKNFTGKSLAKGTNMLLFAGSEEQANLYKSFYERAFAGEIFTEIEYTDNPAEMWSEISFYPIREGDKIIGSACCSRNISESKMAQRTLKQNEIRFREFFDSAPESIVIIDINTMTFSEFNGNALKLLKYSAEELIKKGPVDVSPAFQPDGHASEEKATDMITQAFNGANPVFEWMLLDGSGNEIISEVRLAALSSIRGPQVIANFADITVRKGTEKEIQDLNEHLEIRVHERTAELTEANKGLEAFSATVSYDLRAPARAVTKFTEILREGYADTMGPKEKELFQYIEDGGKRMTVIIDDLLKLAKYGNEKLKLEPVDMTRLVQGVWLNIGRNEPQRAKLELQELGTINVDMSMLQQVVVNLLSNAIKYSSKKEKPVVSVWCERKEEHIAFYFKDNGAGFDMKNYERLFGAFQRFHNARDFAGTGVGLSLVKRIIEKHGGTVGAVASVGEGATFYFTLPIS